ncbi:hypothetical protein [Thermomonospora echinospora]|uniref:hypothetical protein n=1 Tax=Thermomonospora echinospora TaxID=1992 RepID=UPI0011B00CB2|nr:hypothetical protein [Thermomonospora echinospora]
MAIIFFGMGSVTVVASLLLLQPPPIASGAGLILAGILAIRARVQKKGSRAVVYALSAVGVIFAAMGLASLLPVRG